MTTVSGPVVTRTIAELRAALAAAGSIAFVPTMGALHDGHVQLFRHARPLGDVLVASIFVNPTQFGPGEDFDAYPRQFDADLAACERAGVDVVFAPEVDQMYPAGTDGIVMVDPGDMGRVLEGASRPTHFRGVLTVVAKLFAIVRPHVAVFGEKDFQQLALIRSMVRELAIPVDIVGCPIIREDSGLAMSSRNVYLSEDERRLATALSRALHAGQRAGAQGPAAVVAAAREVLDEASIAPDYLVLTNPYLTPDPTQGEARLLVAARVGAPRLLDNIAVHLPPAASTPATSTPSHSTEQDQ